jgi:hypothetical protein
MAYMTLLQAARLMEPSRERAIIELYASENQILAAAPVISTGPAHLWKVEDALPYSTSATGTRAVNGDFTASTGRTKRYEGKVKIYGGKIQVDRYIEHNYPQAVVADEVMQIKALSRQMFIDCFEGAGGQYLRSLSNWNTTDSAYTGQVVNAGATTTPVVVTVDKVDELLSKIKIIPGRTFLYMNDYPCRKILKDTKSTTYPGIASSYTPDSLTGMGGVYTGYGPAVPIIVTQDGKGANMLSITEDDYSGGGANSQSIYAVTWAEDAATLFSSNSQSIPQLLTKTDGSNFNYEVLEWFLGLAPQFPRCQAQLKYVKNALS